jgi:ribosomal protein S4
MNKLKPRNKVHFQNCKNINLHLFKLKKKKWNLLKKRRKKKNEIKPEKKKKFFQKRLSETQEFRNFYGCIAKYQIKKNLNKKKNILFNTFLSLLESRLDINIVRLKLAKTIFQAKQLINHKKIKINNKTVNKSGIILRKGDIINIV